ncbi:MAG: hypothetical protein KDA20_04470 [Phycisphaerales bacterium]|nr:hypothetical protein [Phycisphaerales bacterium]
MKVHCPETGVEIPPDKINVATDVAISPATGKVHRVSVLRRLEEEREERERSPELLANPPEGAWYRRDPKGTIRIGVRVFSSIGIFLLVFAVFWNIGTLIAIVVPYLDPSSRFTENGDDMRFGIGLSQTLLGLPFLAGSIGLSAAALYLTFGRQEVVIECDKASVFRGVAYWGITRKFDPRQVTGIERRKCKWECNDGPMYKLVIDAGPNDRTLGSGIPDKKLDFLLAALRDALLNDPTTEDVNK